MLDKIGTIETYLIDENFDNLSRKEREIKVNKVFKDKYQGKEIKYLLNDVEINAMINSTTKNNFSSRLHRGRVSELKREIRIKQNLAVNNDLIKILSNSNYLNNKNDYKNYKNKMHNKSINWLYFSKNILVNNKVYKLIISIRENKSYYFIYDIKLKEL